MRLLGSIVLVISLGVVGIVFSYALGKRRKELSIFGYGLEILETEIVFAQNPLWLCFENTSKHLSGVVEQIFKEVSKSLKNNDYDDGESAFSHTLWGYQEKLSLTESDLATIDKFSCNLGLTDKGRQGERIRYSLASIAKSITEAEEKEKKWQRLAGFGGWMMGLLFVILLV